jgi:hypothetical protein
MREQDGNRFIQGVHPAFNICHIRKGKGDEEQQDILFE